MSPARRTPPSIRTKPSSVNATLNRQAWKAMSIAERETGMTGEQLRAIQLAQRERVLSRLGLAA